MRTLRIERPLKVTLLAGTNTTLHYYLTGRLLLYLMSFQPCELEMDGTSRHPSEPEAFLFYLPTISRPRCHVGRGVGGVEGLLLLLLISSVIKSRR